MADEKSDVEYERFLAHRNALLSIQKHNITAFDKAIVTLSSGALGLSLIFLDKIGGSGKLEYSILLGAAWFVYLVSILCNLASYRSGFREATRDLADWDSLLLDAEQCPRTLTTKRNVTSILNEISFWAFALGTILLCSFAYMNIGK